MAARLVTGHRSEHWTDSWLQLGADLLRALKLS
jgi:hypothetical protein